MARIYTTDGKDIIKTSAADTASTVQFIIPDAISGQDAYRILEKLRRAVLRGEK
jgi:hypothetical protein